ncbi:undecaprenyl diphosphate synthase family protein, partial [Escherichia coli]|uniref:undecaprenyl diphosphate synthase family protein n=1 Tax=Escherichia coli TaxID=562 RepID=UPI003CFEF27D
IRGARELINDPRVVRGELGFKAVGNLDLLPDYVVDELNRVEKTARGRERFLIACVCYGGRWEILETVRRAVEACKASECVF